MKHRNHRLQYMDMYPDPGMMTSRIPEIRRTSYAEEIRRRAAYWVPAPVAKTGHTAIKTAACIAGTVVIVYLIFKRNK